MPSALKPREATPAHQTWSRLQLASRAPRAGDGDAMERRADRRNARASTTGRHARGGRRKASLPRSCATPKKSFYASVSGNGVLCSTMCLIAVMLQDIGSRYSESIGRVLSSAGSKIMSFSRHGERKRSCGKLARGNGIWRIKRSEIP
jgi:hypothetical protein